MKKEEVQKLIDKAIEAERARITDAVSKIDWTTYVGTNSILPGFKKLFEDLPKAICG